jgi:predicted Zn-dependent protease
LAAQENPRLGDPGRQQVWMNYAQVCLETGRYGEGLAWVRLVQQRSGQAVYRLMEANFLMLQGHLDAAEAVLMEVARQPALTPTDREHLAVLHDAIQQRRAAQTPATDGPG